MTDTFHTITAPAEAEFKDKGSKFLAFAFPISKESDVKVNLEALKKMHPKAVHHCFAYKIGAETRANDDGEPSGSAGKPILNVILSKQLNQILVVVVRYFGGTLLGVSGLINAYKMATANALSSAIIIEKTIDEVHEIEFAFENMNAIMKVLKDHSAKILSQGYTSNYTISFEIRRSLVAVVLEEIEKVKRGW